MSSHKSNSREEGTYLYLSLVLWPFAFWLTDDFSHSSLLFVVVSFTVSCVSKCVDKEVLRAFPFIGSLPLSIHASTSLWGMTERGVRDKVSRIFRILSGKGFGGHRVYTCQQRCQTSSVCRKYNMIGTWPKIRSFSHCGCCLRRMSRQLPYLMTFVCHQLAHGNWRLVWSVGPSGKNWRKLGKV